MASLRVTRKRKEGKTQQSRKRSSRLRGEEDLQSSEDEDLTAYIREGVGKDEADDEGEEEETADAKRLRVARAYLDRVKAASSDRLAEEGGGAEGEEEDGARDSLVAQRLQQKQQEESGRVLRFLASRVVPPAQAAEGRPVSRRHRQSVTAVALTADDSQGFAASKDGLVVQWDVEAGTSVKLEWPAPEPSTSGRDQASGRVSGSGKGQGGGPQGQPQSRHLLALAVSSDGRYLAAGGLDRRIHLWDTRTRQHLQAFRGHRGAISGLAFRDGTHQLFSGSYDRSIKVWSVDDMAYMDSLYGHQSEVVALDCLRQERVVSAGRDRTCRIWKVPEETQLVLRGHSASIDCCAMLSNNDFISGSEDGAVALWSALRKKPLHVVRGAHGPAARGAAPGQASQRGESDGGAQEESDEEEEEEEAPREEPQANGVHPGSERANGALPHVGVGGAVEGWVGAVGVCRGSDLAASGAGDGFVRLWHCDTANRRLLPLHSVPTRGFVNSLAFARSGRFLLVGTGQEPRLGRWGRIKEARNGVLLHSLTLS